MLVLVLGDVHAPIELFHVLCVSTGCGEAGSFEAYIVQSKAILFSLFRITTIKMKVLFVNPTLLPVD